MNENQKVLTDRMKTLENDHNAEQSKTQGLRDAVSLSLYLNTMRQPFRMQYVLKMFSLSRQSTAFKVRAHSGITAADHHVIPEGGGKGLSQCIHLYLVLTLTCGNPISFLFLFYNNNCMFLRSRF